MGLKQKAVETMAKWYVESWFKDALKGKQGEEAQKMAQWFLKNRAKVGAGLGILGTAVISAAQGGVIPEGATLVGEVILFAAAYLRGAGAEKSDSYYKEKAG